MECAWGIKAFKGYLGEDQAQWKVRSEANVDRLSHVSAFLIVDCYDLGMYLIGVGCHRAVEDLQRSEVSDFDRSGLCHRAVGLMTDPYCVDTRASFVGLCDGIALCMYVDTTG